MMKKILLLCFCLASIHMWAAKEKWTTHFAYNSVQLIAVTETETYALANGAMFSVNKVTEQLTKYDNRFGLHGTTIAYLAYDEVRSQLLIMYEDGKLDIVCDGHITYISDLYNKRMTASKKCNNITIYDHWAYLSMEFGILKFDLIRWEFKDTYYIGEDAAEIRVTDVMLHEDSIYAQTPSGNYCASLNDKLVDYRFWHKCTTLPKAFDSKKGKEYTDERGDLWKAEGEKGVFRASYTGEQMYYLPQGPQVNTPYRMTVDRGRLFVVPGGRWAVQYSNPGHVMIYENGEWTNITNSYITSQTGKVALDFMNVAVDPNDENHFFVTSYGTGVYEFQGDKLVKHHTPSNSSLMTAVPSYPDQYTRTDGAMCDNQGYLWVLNAHKDVKNVHILSLDDTSWHSYNLYCKSDRKVLDTPGEIVVDKRNSQWKWMVECRLGIGILLMRDNGTPTETSDDEVFWREEWYDQYNTPVLPSAIYTIAQDENSRLWVGTAEGIFTIPSSIDFTVSNSCERILSPINDSSNVSKYFLEGERVNAFAFLPDKICIGTQLSGVYILNADATEILAHYTSDNTPMPSNTVLSLAHDEQNDILYIGTGDGLVACDIELDVDTSLNTGFVDTSEDNWTYGNMYQWRTHLAYSKVNEVEKMGKKVYALSNHSLFSVDTQTEEIKYYNRSNGLNAVSINKIAFNESQNKMLLTYENGQIDVIDSKENIYNIPDLYIKQANASKQINDIYMYQSKAYLAMNFGIIALDMKKHEIEDTYYIDKDKLEVNVRYVFVFGDSIYAVTNTTLYSAHLNDNLMDFSYWNQCVLPSGKDVQGICAIGNVLGIIRDNVLWSRQDGQWIEHKSTLSLRSICTYDDVVYATVNNAYGVVKINIDFTQQLQFEYGQVNDIIQDGNIHWLATESNGLVRVKDGNYSEYRPNGPISNTPYRMRFFGDRLYVLPGGRWAVQNLRQGEIMYYEDGQWTNITNGQLVEMSNHALYDFMNVAQDPADKEHYFITTYGTGMLEMYGKDVVKLHLPYNSGLQSAVASNPDFYTRTDGAMFDDQGNLWVLNAHKDVNNIQILTPDNIWYSYNLYTNGERRVLDTPGEILVDKRNSQWKWIPECRLGTGIILLKDNGTPTDNRDDKVQYHSEWFDQYNNLIKPEFIYTLAQDQDNTIWVGTSKGVFTIPASVDFMTSNKCERIVIRRNDGTDLGDYLLDGEQVNCIVVDGANRKWIGTANSGAFLIQITTDEVGNQQVETVEHFTVENSLLPSDNILSIAIQESTGEVFFGTSEGLVSYMSDASQPEETFDNLYVYPNPVSPTYKGYITIKGVMSNTIVRILDANGNLVKIMESTGGSAIWDGTNAQGNRVASGIYTIICNTSDGQSKGVTKVLILN